MMKRLLRGGARSSAPQHYSGARVVSARAFSHARSLTAAAVAVAMMASVAVTAFIPTYSANADQSKDDGAFATSNTIHMGDGSTDVNEADTGLATYVGRDFYVGAPTDGETGTADGSIHGSWAAEMEGQTFILGKYMQRAQKGFFTIGTVAFGAQYKPAAGSTIIAVKGTNTNLSGASTAQAWKSSASGIDTTQGAGISGNYQGVVGGNKTTLWGMPSCSKVTCSSIYKYGSGTTPDSDVTWNYADWSNVKDGQGNTIDSFGDKFKSNSKQLSTLKDTGGVEYGDAPAQQNYERKKYDWNKYSVYDNDDVHSGYHWNTNHPSSEKNFSTYKLQMSFNSGDEKLITFTGDKESKLQVFTVKASELNTDKGIDFWFRNIPDGASVVINVVNENGSSNEIQMRTGWRFWWGGASNYDDPDTAGAKEISNGYVMGGKTGNNNQIPYSADSNADTYSKVSQKLMWNFPTAQKVTIMGGRADNATVKKLHADGTNWSQASVTSIFNSSVSDDPSAAMLGSIMVPDGSLESHVTTNGRVYVGDDFMMYNPTQAKHNGGDINSASIIDMDQERHNFPWSGALNNSASITWKKVAGNTATPLGGTTWTVYGNLQNAINNSGALITLTDNGGNDWDSADGTLQVDGLKTNATYYLREQAAASGYAKNTNIYRIDTTEGGTDATTIVKVYDANGAEITDDSKKLLTTEGAIINETAGTELAWSKVDGTSNSGALAGSEWQLTRTDTDPQQTWNITDNTTTPTSVSLLGADGNAIADLTLDKGGDTAPITVKVDPSDASQQVKWTGADGYENVARISSAEGSGTFNVIAVGKGSTTFTVCSASDSKVCNTLNVTVTNDSAASLTLYKDGDTNKTSLVGQTVSLKYNGTLQLAAEVQPANTVLDWESSKTGIATVSDNGLVTAVSAGNADITVKAGNLSQTVHITVKQKSTVVYYYATGVPQIHYAVGDNWNTNDVNSDPAMSSISGCNDWYSYEIANPDSKEVKVTFHFGSGDWDNNGGSNSSYASGGYVEAMTINKGKLTTTVPAISDCNVSTVAARNINAHVYSAVLRSGETDGIAANFAKPIADEETISTKADLDSGVGKFRVSLDNGKYTLKETKAPTGYVLSETTYTIVVRDGQIVTNESNLPTDNKIPNDRKNGVVVWDKKDTGDDGSSATNDDSLLGGTSWTLTQTQAWNAETASMVAVSGDDYTHTLTDNGGDGVYADKDSTAGKFRFEGLPWGVYTLKEQKRDGFAANNTTYAFVIDANSVSEEIHLTIVDSAEKSNATAETVYNNRETGSVTWAKVAAGTSTKLSGSQWTLKRVSVWNGTAFAALNSAETWNITDCDATCTPVNAGDPYDSDATAGQFKLAGLKWGEYELVETVAPDGYNLDTTAHKFTIGPKDSTVVLEAQLGNIENQPGVVLPGTGGDGNMKTLATGLLVAMASVATAGLALKVRRRRQ